MIKSTKPLQSLTVFFKRHAEETTLLLHMLDVVKYLRIFKSKYVLMRQILNISHGGYLISNLNKKNHSSHLELLSVSRTQRSLADDGISDRRVGRFSIARPFSQQAANGNWCFASALESMRAKTSFFVGIL